MTTLDVGCGNFKRGDIGLDREPHSNVDVVCDLEREPIPYPDNSFEKVVSYHFLEHVENPEQVLCEMVRVSRKDILVVVPYRWGYDALGHGHKSVFGFGWFAQFARKYGLEVRHHYSYAPFLLLIPRPYELIVELRKKKT